MKRFLTFTLILALLLSTAFAVSEKANAESDVSKTVYFGSYEQDGDLTNGPEPIEWYAIEGKGNSMLLLSKYVLDWQYYDKNSMQTPYKQSSLCKWLKESFYEQAFTDAEKAAIHADRREGYYDGEAVFLHPCREEEEHFQGGGTLQNLFDRMQNKYRLDTMDFYYAFPTQYCAKQGAYIHPSTGACTWWIRDGRHFLNYGGGASVDNFARSETVTRRGVRPCVSVDAEYLGFPLRRRTFDLSDPGVTLVSARMGDYIYFGTYEQDNDLSNGKEPIKWILLERRDDGSFVLTSECALEYKQYNESETPVTWENCTLRRWLNEDYYQAAFSTQEQEKIQSVRLENEDNPEFGTKGGNATVDKVWLLSINEVTDLFGSKFHYEYFSDFESRLCAMTRYCDPKYQDEYNSWGTRWGWSVDGATACDWWLRSPGYDSGWAAIIMTYVGYYYDSGVDLRGYPVDCDLSVRPVVVVQP